MLGYGPHMFDNGPNVLGKSTFGLMSHSELLYSMWHSEFCHTQNLVAFGIMSHSGLFVRHYVVRDYVAFGVMLFGIMLHSALCRIRTYVIQDNVVQHNVVRRNVVWPTVGVSIYVKCDGNLKL